VVLCPWIACNRECSCQGGALRLHHKVPGGEQQRFTWAWPDLVKVSNAKFEVEHKVSRLERWVCRKDDEICSEMNIGGQSSV
jgi:hypothetical protein